MRMRPLPLTFISLSALAVLLLARTSLATPTFPAAIVQHLSLSYTPQCALCHSDGNVGGIGTATTPFGDTMRALGVVAFDTTALTAALDADEAMMIDSDGDCVPDITELKNDTNPNVPDSGKTCTPTVLGNAGPTYGCELGRDPAGLDGIAMLFGAAGIIALRRRRRVE